MQLLNFVIDVMLKNEVYLYSHSSNEWLDELEYYTHCHLHIVLLIVQPIGWTNESTNMHKCWAYAKYLLST